MFCAKAVAAKRVAMRDSRCILKLRWNLCCGVMSGELDDGSKSAEYVAETLCLLFGLFGPRTKNKRCIEAARTRLFFKITLNVARSF